MGGQSIKRTLKRAVDLETSKTITSDELLKLPRDDYQKIRRAATSAHIEGKARFVCDRCGHSVYAPLEPRTNLPFWRHYRGAPTECPWWTGIPHTVDAVGASQFGGAQESPLHWYLKHLIGELLEHDPDTQVGSVVVDRYLVTDDGRRRPDVRAISGTRRIAIEIQLATTQIVTIVGRESFYDRTGFSLLWFTWQFDPSEHKRMLMGFEDIFYSHNKNLLSIDTETVNFLESKSASFFESTGSMKANGT